MSSQWKNYLTLGCILAAVYLLIPSFKGITQDPSKPHVPSWWEKFVPEKTVSLGLDLRGGVYVELEVDLEEALENRVDVLSSEMERMAASDKIGDIQVVALPQSHRLQVKVGPENLDKVRQWLRENFSDSLEPVESNPPVFGSIDYQLTQKTINHIKDMAIKQSVEAVRNRVDRYGVAEASIQMQGEGRIVVELPGVQDPDRIIEVMRKTGLLEFKLVDETINSSKLRELVDAAKKETQAPDGYSKEITDKLNQALMGKIPEGTELHFQIDRDPVTKNIVGGVPFLLTKKTAVSGDMLQDARVGVHDSTPHVSLMFDKMGSENFGTLTRDNVGKRLAIVLDGNVFMEPVINEPILNGQAQISLGYGSYDSLVKEAEDLALILREGALPASLKVATKTLIGPSLGRDSIEKALQSMFWAAVVIVVFMIFYYRISGVIAVLALLFNVLFIFAILALFQASLTLPGMAGIVLTMGMAVDANIIIFERMREEKRLGKTARAIVTSGYSNAMSSIIDSNLTTLISGLVLFQFGTGPIKGFATTLIIGIITTMFTAIVMTRVAYDIMLSKWKVKTISV